MRLVARTFPNYEATLGLFALTRFDIVIDGKNGHLFTRAIRRPKSRYAYNRIGAVFVPRDANSNDLVAHVMEKSAAYRAGIRDGDILVRIGNLDVTKWRTDPKVFPLSRFWSQPAGTQLELSLTRDAELVKATVELTEIFVPRHAHE
jgi:C-terminal processing protease CtpA/Prc